MIPIPGKFMFAKQNNNGQYGSPLVTEIDKYHLFRFTICETFAIYNLRVI